MPRWADSGNCEVDRILMSGGDAAVRMVAAVIVMMALVLGTGVQETQ